MAILSKSQLIVATCVGCGCTDDKGCPLDDNGYSCTWLEVDYRAKVGICSRCASRENSNKYKEAIAVFVFSHPNLATAKQKKIFKVVNDRSPENIYRNVNRREFLSNEKRKEGRVE